MLTWLALIIFFSKSLLRHPLARSSIEEFEGDTQFKWIIEDPEHGKAIEEPEKIERVILCTGQVYAALYKHRQDNGIKDTAITRIEQLNPFPWQQLKDNLDSYPNAKTIVWAQEEPLNAGAWSFTQPRIETVLNQTENHDRKHVMYAGRNPSASVATGLKASHTKEEKELLDVAFSVTQDKLKGEWSWFYRLCMMFRMAWSCGICVELCYGHHCTFILLSLSLMTTVGSYMYKQAQP